VAREEWQLSREDVAKAEVIRDERGGVAVAISFTEQGQEKMGKLTEGWVGKRLAVLLDGKVVSAPVLKTKITTAALISNVTAADADRVVKALNPQ
jgi:preprotein translocase subunit SecD